MSADDDLRSVRIEVEGAVAPSADAPELQVVEASATPTWVGVLALLVLGSVGAALVLLQPDTSAASQEPLRSEPAVLPADDDDSSNLTADAEGTAEAEAAAVTTEQRGVVQNSALTPVKLDLEWEVDSIVATDNGFFGLEATETASSEPSIFLSTDGVEWLPANATVALPGNRSDELFVWSRLSRIESGFAVTGRSDGRGAIDLFLSGDGTTWRNVSDFGSNSNAATTPVFVNDESVIGMTRVGGIALNGVINTHTNIGGGDPVNICENFAETDLLLLVTCDGELLRLSAEDVVSDRPAIEILQCVQRLARVGFGATPVAGSIFDLSTGEERPFLPVAGAYDLSSARPSSAPLALLDFGVIDDDVRTGPSDPQLPDDVCEGIAEVPTVSEPAVVVIEPDRWTNGFRRLPFPADGISTNPANVSVVGILEFEPANAGVAPQQHVVVQRPGGAVWLADVQTQAWTWIGGENRLGRELVTIDDAGKRIYQLNADALTAFNIEFTDDAEASSVEVTNDAPFVVEQTRAPLAGPFRGLDRVLFANDNVVFFTDATDAWMVDVSGLGAEPPPADIDPFRLAPAAESSQIVLTPRGLIGLPQRGVGPLRLLLSVNGFDWVVADTTATSLGEPLSAEYFWLGLSETETGFALWGSRQEGNGANSQQVDLFTSDDGLNWDRVTGFGSLGAASSISIPAAVDDEWVLAREFEGDRELTQILVDHTNIDIPEDGMCALDRRGVDIRVFSCLGEEFPVRAENVTSDVLPAQVLNCLGSLVFTNSFSSTLLTITNRVSGEVQRLNEPLTGSGFSGVRLSNGSTVLRDEGLFVTVDEDENPSVERICVGIAEPREGRAAAAVIVDREGSAVTRFALPELGQTFGQSASSELIGAVAPTGSDQERYVLFAIGDALWSLDMREGEWALLAPADDAIEEGTRTAFGLDRSGTRVYRVASEVTVFDLTFSEAGQIGTSETTFSIEQSGGPSTRFNAGSVLFADTERVFYRDFFLGGAVWSFDIPARAVEDADQ